MVALFFLFESELGYNLLVSSFIFEILLLELFVLLRSERFQPTVVLQLLLFLVAARGPLAFAAIGAIAIFVLLLRPKITPTIVSTAILVSSCIFLANASQTICFFCNQASLSIANPLIFGEAEKLSEIRNWVLPNAITEAIHQSLETFGENFPGFNIWNRIGSISRSSFTYLLSSSRQLLFGFGMAEFRQIATSNRINLGISDFVIARNLDFANWRFAEHQFHGFLVLAIFALAVLFESALAISSWGSYL